MAGHSKWKGIKHKKAIVDAARGKVFTKVIREITVAARMGGGSPDANSRLRLALVKAREANLPKDRIDQAIKRGTGDLPGVTYEEQLMEAYGPGGVAILVEILTDNKNRTAPEMRSILTKHGGNSAGAGAVAWMFQKKGIIAVPMQGQSEDALMEIALEAGADDLKVEGDMATITASPQALEPVKQALAASKIPVESADLTMVPSTNVRVDNPDIAKQLLALLDALEEQDDSQHVYANFEIPDELLAQLQES